ncbi:MAG: hypothetical protein FJ147_02115 [Deltaproteobacteria bacterium]|nr:hypothetical protein [Deltaproteobacteria bacterium]
MSSTNPNPSPNTTQSRSILQTIGAVFDGILTFIRKAPMVVLFGAFAVILYFQYDDQSSEKELAKFSPVQEMEREPEIPADFPKDANPHVLTCVHKVNADLDKSLWADVYYGMEVRLDGKMFVAKVTEQWQDLSGDKQKTVVQFIVDTWVQHAQTLKIFTSGEEMDEVTIKRLPDDHVVATWKPATGVEIIKN